MSDISKAIKELREAVEGDGVEEQCHKILNNIVTRIDPDNAAVDKAYISPAMILGVVTFEEIRDIAKSLYRWGNQINTNGGWILPRTAIPSPTPSLDARIQAAAEEIATMEKYVLKGSLFESDIAAIIKRHLEGGK